MILFHFFKRIYENIHQLQLIQPSMLWLFSTSSQNDGCIRPLHNGATLYPEAINPFNYVYFCATNYLSSSSPYVCLAHAIPICPNMYMCMSLVFFVIPAVVWWRKTCVPLTWRAYNEQKAQPASVELDLQ